MLRLYFLGLLASQCFMYCELFLSLYPLIFNIRFRVQNKFPILVRRARSMVFHKICKMLGVLRMALCKIHMLS